LKWTGITFQNWSEYCFIFSKQSERTEGVVARSQILLSQKDGSGLDAEEQGVAVAGVVAREVLRD